MKIRLAQVDPSAPWGQPLFVDGSGRPVYLGRGADGTDDDDEDGSDSGGADDADDDDAGDKDEKDGKNKAGAEADAEALRNKIRLADKRAAEAERKLQELTDKDKSALEVAERKLAEAEAKTAELATKLKTKALENAFMAVNEYTWHDPDDAIAAATRLGLLEGVQDDDGEVDQTKLKAALVKLIKAKPHYLKSEKSEDDEDETPKGPSGTPTGSARKKAAKTAASEAALRARYPALRH
jgi:hypothetical protein